MLYTFLKPIGKILFALYFRLSGEGVSNIPSEGPYIIAANHSSFLDPPLLAAVCPQKIRFVMLESYYYSPWLHWFCSIMKAIPIKQGTSDPQAIKKSLQTLERGEVVGIFPEGRRSKTGKLTKASTGVGLIALKSEVPVVPAAIIGAYESFPIGSTIPKPLNIRVKFEEPVDPDNFSDKEELTEKLMGDIENLLAESSHSVENDK